MWNLVINFYVHKLKKMPDDRKTFNDSGLAELVL